MNRAGDIGEIRPLASIRGFAALWVVYHHWLATAEVPTWAANVLAGGYTAVDMFFILSGLILTKAHGALTPRGLPDFWLRRACRLYPLHWVTLAVLVALVTWPATPAVLHGGALLGLVCSALLIHPFLPISPLANPPSWSAGIELACYAGFPAALAVLRRARRLWALGALVGLLATAEWLVTGRYAGATTGLGALLRGLAGFGLGMALWKVGRRIATVRAWRATLGEVAGLAGVVTGATGGWPHLVPVSSALLLLALSFDAGLAARFLRQGWCVWLGHISFSMYLVHYPLAVAAERLFGPAGPHTPARWLCLTGVLLLLSTATWRWVEEPGRRLPRRLQAWRAAGRVLRPAA
jgi:peptidoglycan/LPS O-acetylase OafA/YrhL